MVGPFIPVTIDFFSVPSPHIDRADDYIHVVDNESEPDTEAEFREIFARGGVIGGLSTERMRRVLRIGQPDAEMSEERFNYFLQRGGMFWQDYLVHDQRGGQVAFGEVLERQWRPALVGIATSARNIAVFQESEK